MSQYFCGNGHSWIANHGQETDECPACQANKNKKDAENKEMAAIIKQAVLEALREHCTIGRDAR